MNERGVMGFDFGMKRLGIAVGQELTRTASPLVTLDVKNGLPDWTALASLIQQWQPEAFVVGLPQHRDGKPHRLAPLITEFCTRLQNQYQCPVYTVDEHLSSYAAESELKERGHDPRRHKKQIDALAASIILQHWLEQQSNL